MQPMQQSSSRWRIVQLCKQSKWLARMKIQKPRSHGSFRSRRLRPTVGENWCFNIDCSNSRITSQSHAQRQHRVIQEHRTVDGDCAITSGLDSLLKIHVFTSNNIGLCNVHFSTQSYTAFLEHLNHTPILCLRTEYPAWTSSCMNTVMNDLPLASECNKDVTREIGPEIQREWQKRRPDLRPVFFSKLEDWKQ
jgi:hypothetical protein